MGVNLVALTSQPTQHETAISGCSRVAALEQALWPAMTRPEACWV